MMDADAPVRRRPRAVPAGIINMIGRWGELIQLDQREIHVSLGRAKGRPALIVGRRSAESVQAAGGRFVIPIDHDGRSVAGGDAAVVGSQEEGAEIARGVHDERAAAKGGPADADRKSTRLNSSHLGISYAVFCLKK